MSVSPAEHVPTLPYDPAARRRIGWIGAGLIALGVARGWVDAAALVRDLSHQVRPRLAFPSSSPWTDYGGVAWGAWPILVGIVLIVRRPSTWLKAAAITALALSVEQAARLTASAVFDSGWSLLYRGGFDRVRSPLLPQGIKLAVRVGAALGWFVLGFAATREAARSRVPIVANVRRRRRRVQFPNAASTLFAAAVLGWTGWATYIQGLERLPWARAWVLNGVQPRTRPRAFETPVMRQLREAEKFLAEGNKLVAGGKLAEARRALIKGVNRLEATMDEYPNDTNIRREFALAANELAWFLATCEDASLRDAEAALAVSRKSLAADPHNGNALNTMAVAHFRAGEYDEASKVFAESMGLREGGDSFDWYFLAQIEAIRNHPVEASALYDKAVAWGADRRPFDAELYRFRVEAANRLGLAKPEGPAPTGPKSLRAAPPMRIRRRQ